MGEWQTFDCLWKSVHKFIKTNNKSVIGWNPFNLQLSQCRDQKKIEFNCFVAALRIIYKNGEVINEMVDGEDTFAKSTKFEWNISENEMKRFNASQIGKTFYSQNFGHLDFENFCFFIVPKGLNTNCLQIYLRLLRLPTNIKKMRIRYWMTVKYETNDDKKKGIIIKTESHSVDVGFGYNHCTKQCLMNQIPNISQLSLLSIGIKIKLENIINLNNECIPNQEWKRHGIVMNNENDDSLKSLHLLNKIKSHFVQILPFLLLYLLFVIVIAL